MRVVRGVVLAAVLVSWGFNGANAGWELIADLSSANGGVAELTADPAHGRLFLATGRGYRIYFPDSASWLIREVGGSMDSSTYCFLADDSDSLFLLTGRMDDYWYGYIMDNSGLTPLGPHVLDGAFGAIMGMGRSPDSENVLFACAMIGDGPGGIYRSLNGGQTWSLVHNFYYDSSGTALAVAPNGDVLVGHGSPGYPYTNNGILRSEDGGDTWVEISGDMPCAAFIGRVEVDPLDSQHIYARQGGYWEQEDPALGVYETRDGGVHWTQVFQGDVWEFCMHPYDANILAVVEPWAIMLTRDGGATWENINEDLPYAPGPEKCAICPTDERLYIASYQLGMWAYALDPTTAEQVPSTGTALAAYPNPFNPSTTLTFSLRRAGAVSLSIVDVQGRNVRSLLAGEPRPAGQQTVTWDGRDDRGQSLPSGLYFAQLKADGEHLSRKLLLLK